MASLVLACRPWSLPASVVPVALTLLCVADRIAAPPLELAALVTAVVCLHLAGNLFNTYFDFNSGADTKDSADDRALVDGTIAPRTVLLLAIACFVLGGGLGAWQCMQLPLTALTIPAAGGVIALWYTARAPFSLKHNGLGDLAIFLAFGPLLCSGAALAATRSTALYAPELCISVAIGAITVNILHANNTRDVAADAAVGARTLAMALGFEYSYAFFVANFVAAYVASACGIVAALSGSRSGGLRAAWDAVVSRAVPRIGITLPAALTNHHIKTFLTDSPHSDLLHVCAPVVLLLALTLPTCVGLVGQFRGKRLAQLPQLVAQFNLLFGVAVALSLLSPSVGRTIGQN